MSLSRFSFPFVPIVSSWWHFLDEAVIPNSKWLSCNEYEFGGRVLGHPLHPGNGVDVEADTIPLTPFAKHWVEMRERLEMERFEDGFEDRLGEARTVWMGVKDVMGDVVFGGLCREDSDNDGYTNGQELGDPECTGTPGVYSRDNLSDPNDPDSVPEGMIKRAKVTHSGPDAGRNFIDDQLQFADALEELRNGVNAFGQKFDSNYYPGQYHHRYPDRRLLQNSDPSGPENWTWDWNFSGWLEEFIEREPKVRLGNWPEKEVSGNFRGSTSRQHLQDDNLKDSEARRNFTDAWCEAQER